MNIRCYVFSISENKIVNYNYGVDSNSLPIVGLDPDLKLYAEHFTNSEAPIDSRVLISVLTEGRVEQAHPVYPSLLTYQKTYSTQRRQLTELIEAIREAENSANETLFPYVGRVAKLTKAHGINAKKIAQIALDSDEQALSDEMDSLMDAMNDNADNAQDLIDFAEANVNNIPNLNDGWVTSIQ